jgi:hypothetical protein
MKKSQKSLRDWTNQKWRTSDGSPSKGKKRYLPDAAWKALSPGEKAATNRAKAKGDKKGKQFVKQPKNIAKKTAKYRAMGGLISSKFQNGGVLPKYETTLSQKEEANFMPWLESQYKAGNITKGDFDFYKKNNYGYNYDFRAAYKEGLKSSLNSKDNMQHWGDIGKKPNHPTFSNESKYHNVDGNIGGSWDGENFIPAYVAPDLLEVEITPEGTELKDQPRELEAYYRDYAAQYPVTDKKDITKQYKERARNYAAEQLLKANPQGDRDRKDWLNSFTSQELAVLRNSESKGKVNPTLLQKFEGALKKGAAAGAPGDLRYKKVETESLTDEEMKDVGGLDLLGPLAIPAKLVQAGYKDGYSFLDALKGQENDASLIEDIATDPLNLVGIGLVSKGANAAKLLKAYKNLSKLSNTKRASTLQNAYKLRNNPSYVINPEVRSTKKLAKESEPYLKSSTPPRSRQDEIVEGFAPGLRQERIKRTTVNFNPDGSEIGKDVLASSTDNLANTLGKSGDEMVDLYRIQGKDFKDISPNEFINQKIKGYKKDAFKNKLNYYASYIGLDKPPYPSAKGNRTVYKNHENFSRKRAKEAADNPLNKNYGNWWTDKPEYIMEINKVIDDPFNAGYSRFKEPTFLKTQIPKSELEKYNLKTLSKNKDDVALFSENLRDEFILPYEYRVNATRYNNIDELFPKPTTEKAMGGTLNKSVMGYRDDSPYKNEPYIDINTPTGEIDMSKTGVSLYANGKLLKPYSGKHKFNTSKVREVPVSNSWLDKYK